MTELASRPVEHAELTPTRWTVWDFVWVILLGFLVSQFAVALYLGVTGSAEITAILLFAVAAPSQALGIFAGLFWVRTRRGYRSFEDAYGLTARPSDARYLFLGAGLNIGLTLLFTPLAVLMGVTENPQISSQLVSEVREPVMLLITAFVLAVVAPVTEELTFRGLLLRLIDQRAGPTTAIVISSVFFGLTHLTTLRSFDGRTVLEALALAVPQLAILGFVMARSTVRSGNLGPAIFTHAGYNLLTLGALILAPSLIEGV